MREILSDRRLHPGKSAGRRSRVFSIGGVGLLLSSESVADLNGGSELDQFERQNAEIDINATISWQDSLAPSTSESDFESGATWRLSRAGNNFIFDFTSSALGKDPYKRMSVDENFSNAEITLSASALECFPHALPVEYPVCELLITNHLAWRGLGVEVHGCGLIDIETGGHLFVGHSGAGKSTTARLWESVRAAEILSDDRLILRFHKGELWMYGTPWHGEAAFATPARAKLKRISVLQHGTANRFVPMNPGRAAGELFARSFPPFHSRVGLERTIEFFERVARTVPCFEFHFMPDQSAIAAVLDFDRLG